MLTYLRYTLATFCFLASVGCLLMWWRTNFCGDYIGLGDQRTPFGILEIAAHTGEVFVTLRKDNFVRPALTFWTNSPEMIRDEIREYQSLKVRGQAAGWYRNATHIQLWYPALIFALAGVGVLRFSRRFSIRSIIIATTVAAASIGMAVIL